MHPLVDRDRRCVQRRNLRILQRIRPLTGLHQIKGRIAHGHRHACRLQPEHDVVNTVAVLVLISLDVLIAVSLNRRQHGIKLSACNEAVDVRLHGLLREIQPIIPGILRKRRHIIHKMQLHHDVHVVVRDLLHRFFEVQGNRLQILPVEIRHLKVQLSKRDMRETDPHHIVLNRLSQGRVVSCLELRNRLLHQPVRLLRDSRDGKWLVLRRARRIPCGFRDGRFFLIAVLLTVLLLRVIAVRSARSQQNHGAQKQHNDSCSPDQRQNIFLLTIT